MAQDGVDGPQGPRGVNLFHLYRHSGVTFANVPLTGLSLALAAPMTQYTMLVIIYRSDYGATPKRHRELHYPPGPALSHRQRPVRPRVRDHIRRFLHFESNDRTSFVRTGRSSDGRTLYLRKGNSPAFGIFDIFGIT